MYHNMWIRANVFHHREDLEDEVWSCTKGHPVCGECIDIDNIDCDDTATSVHTESGIEDDISLLSSNLSSQTSQTSEQSLVGSMSQMEISSYVRYVEIDISKC